MVLQKGLMFLRPVVKLVATQNSLETYEEVKVQKQYEACAYVLWQIDELARENLTSCYKLRLTDQAHSVLPWLNELMISFAFLEGSIKELSKTEKKEIKAVIKTLREAVLALDIYEECQKPEEAYAQKIKTMQQLAKLMEITEPLPQYVEEVVQGIWKTLEDHAPPQFKQQLIEQNKEMQLERGVLFSAGMSEQLRALQIRIALLENKGIFSNPLAKQDLHHIDQAFIEIKAIMEKPVWYAPEKQPQAFEVYEIMEQLGRVMVKFDLNPAVAESSDIAVQRSYESMWCVVGNIIASAQKQYPVDLVLPTKVIAHPFVAEMKRALEDMEQVESTIEFAGKIRHALDRMITNDDPYLALEKKWDTVSEISMIILGQRPPISVLLREHHPPPDISEEEHYMQGREIALALDAMSALLLRHCKPEQRNQILEQLDYSPYMPRYVFKGQEGEVPTKQEFVFLDDEEKQTALALVPAVYLTSSIAAQLNTLAQKLEPVTKAAWETQANELEKLADDLKVQWIEHPQSREISKLRGHPPVEMKPFTPLESLTPEQTQKLNSSLEQTGRLLEKNVPVSLKHIAAALRGKIDDAKEQLNAGQRYPR